MLRLPLSDRSWRTIRRFAEIVCPPELRASGLSPALRTQLDLYLDSLPRASRFLVLSAFVGFDQGARLTRSGFGRRFALLDDDRADAYLRARLSSGHQLWRRLTKVLKAVVTMSYYELPHVKTSLGYEPEPYIASLAKRRLKMHGDEIAQAEDAVVADDAQAEKPRPRRRSGVGLRPGGVVEGRDAKHDLEVSCDVVVVGSGAGGATFAAALADAGVDVVVVEEGPYRQTESFDANLAEALRTRYRGGGFQVALGSPPVVFLEGRCVGGSTVVNGGISWPTPAHVLERWTREEHVDAVTPSAMAPYFARVERRLSVAYQDKESIGRDSELLKAGADAKGWTIVPDRRAQVRCAGCNNCTLGCPTGAKRSMLVTNVRRALSRGARLYADCQVEQITRIRKRATGVVGRFIHADGRPGPRLRVRARAVVSACGAVQTPTLLKRSGFSSPSGQLGRNLYMHPNAAVIALFDEEVVGWHGVHQAYQVHEFRDDGILISAVNVAPSLVAFEAHDYGRELGKLMARYNRMVTAGCLIEDTAAGRVDVVRGIGPIIRYQISDVDSKRVVRGVALSAELMFAAGARRVLLPFDGVPDLRDGDQAQALASTTIPREAMELSTVHVMGTARMSEDRSRGVVSSFGELHDARSLFVADASLLPGPVGVNPMETIMALALRNADHLLQEAQRYGL